ncbi:MAG: TetR/AcrR family transcriptional regulator [Pseudomonadota bacterium]
MAETKSARRGYHHGDLRADLIAVVRALIESDGPDHVSIAEAARRAGVSSAAPYKHFRDRTALMNAVAADAMDRLRADMRAAADAHPAGSLAQISALGVAYVAFAVAQPGVFRLMFGLTEGHEDAPELLEKGEATFGIVIAAVAAYLGVAPDDPRAGQRAYMLWAFVHGHSFLWIDKKAKVSKVGLNDAALIHAMSDAVLNRADPD